MDVSASGMSAARAMFDYAAHRAANVSTEPVRENQLVDAFTGMTLSGAAHRANATAYRVADEVRESIIDLRAS